MTLLIIIIILVLLTVPSVILGELIYSASRTTDYDPINGFQYKTLQTTDNVDIHVWFTQSHDKAVILTHGHGDHSKLIYERYGSIFENLDYDIVLIDMRNHGKSEHSPPITMGIDERFDVLAALQWMKSQWQEIIAFGTSMGSIATLLAHNEEHIADRLIIDSSFSDPIAVMRNNFQKNNLIQPWRWLVIQYLTRLRAGVTQFPDILSILQNLTIPTLVVHGSADVEAPPSFLLDVDNLNNTQIITSLISEGEHSRLHQQEAFVDIVTKFVRSEK